MKKNNYLLEIVNELLVNKKILSRIDINLLLEQCQVCRTTLQKELLKLKIPFVSKSIKITLKSIGVDSDGKNINLTKISSLKKWQKKLLTFSKIKIHFNCKKCLKNSVLTSKNIFGRKYLRGESICAKCILSTVTNLDSWKSSNSKAQLIAQNKTEQLEKNRQAQIERFKNPETIKKHSESGKKKWKDPEYRKKMCKIAQEKWKNPEYAEKVIRNSKNSFNTGWYKGLYFDSSYELAFILKIEIEEGDIKCLQRANFFINYENSLGKKSVYYPDFILKNKYLVEVKGYGPWADLENIELKNRAAKIWCIKNDKKYRLIEKQDLTYHYINKARKLYKSNNNEIKKCKKKNVQGESF